MGEPFRGWHLAQLLPIIGRKGKWLLDRERRATSAQVVYENIASSGCHQDSRDP